MEKKKEMGEQYDNLPILEPKEANQASELRYLSVNITDKNHKIQKYKVDAYHILCYYDFEICICACQYAGKKFWFWRSPKE